MGLGGFSYGILLMKMNMENNLLTGLDEISDGILLMETSMESKLPGFLMN